MKALFYVQIKNGNKFTKDGLVPDLVLLLFAGSNTTIHILVEMMYFIKITLMFIIWLNMNMKTWYYWER